ncbi:DUF6082 family protein [Nonomuraea sp. NPDC047529]|uniref:DUF6082 family protein n=1 Tax=Nonomuraea sp. NPDC047529 TaxID=3155623 RepID=UPI0033D23A54
MIPPDEWAVLSEIGQAYGPASALLAALSLLGVAYSLIVQARTAGIMAQDSMRTMHLDLILRSIDRPALSQAHGGQWSGPEDDFDTQIKVMANAWTSYWFGMHASGVMDDNLLRTVARNYFRGEAGRAHWRANAYGYRVDTQGRRKRTFCRIMDEELIRAEPVKPNPLVSPPPAVHKEPILIRLLAGICLVLAAAIYRKWRFRR